jgi:hypothetical protein
MIILLAVAAGGCGTVSTKQDGGGGGGGGGGGSGGAGGGVDGSQDQAAGGSGGGGASDGGQGGDAGVVTIPQNGLALWLKADHGATVSSGSVTLWHDQGPNGVDATPAGSDGPPQLVVNAQGTLPAVHFEGNRAMTLPQGFSDWSGGVSAFAVARFHMPADTSQFRDVVIFDFLTRDAQSNPVGDFLMQIGDTGSGLRFEYYSAPTYVGPFGSSYDAWTLYEVIQSGGTPSASTGVTMLENGNAVGGSTAPLPPTVVRTENTIGETTDLATPTIQLDLGELIIYNRALSDQERTTLESQLKTRWGL